MLTKHQNAGDTMLGVPSAGDDAPRDPSVAVVDELFQGARSTPYTFLMLTIGLIVTVAEGGEINALSTAAPLIARHFALSSNVIAAMLACNVAGTIVASFALSPVADRIGRRPATLIGLSLALLGTILAPFAPSWQWLFASQIVASLGIGLTTPSVYALVAELVPTRMRAMATMITGCGLVLGGGVSTLLASDLTGHYGYQAPFFVAAAMEATGIFACLALVEESPFFMVAKGESATKVAKLLRRLGVHVNGQITRFVTRHGEAKQGNVRLLLVQQHRTATLLMWLSVFCTLGISYLVINWLPTLLIGTGQDIRAALRFISLSWFIGAGAAMAISWLTTRINPAYVVIAGAIVLVLGAIWLGLLNGVTPAFYPVLLVYMVTTLVVQLSLMGVINRYYASQIRATGVGYALGAGRVGAILGSLAGGPLVSAGFSINGVFAFTAIPAAFVCSAILFLFLSGRLRADGRS